MSVRETLIRAKALIAVPERWCKGAIARDAQGKPTYSIKDEACSFCMYGALLAETQVGQLGDVTSALVQAIEAIELENGTPDRLITVGYFNDSHTHEEVLAAFDRAIARAIAKEENPPCPTAQGKARENPR